tara:strand:+ start:11712 stop:12500 length:789 start_codon:yes stop_codon:yes gene_type:complete
MKKGKFLGLYIVIFILSVLVIVSFGLFINKEVSRYSNHLEWEHNDAIAQYNLLTAKYGVPNILSTVKGGMAVWTKSQLMDGPFERLELLDESVSHCVPFPHRDFLYSFVKYEVPDDKVLDVISLSGSVAYDPLKKLLRARCGSEAANIATLYLATAIGNGITKLDNVQQNKLYAQAINSLSNPQNTALYLEILTNNLNEQPGNSEWSGFFPLAFPEGCCDGYDPVENTCSEDFFTGHDKPDKFADKSDKNKVTTNVPPVLFN